MEMMFRDHGPSAPLYAHGIMAVAQSTVHST